jgi:hypothetical protein
MNVTARTVVAEPALGEGAALEWKAIPMHFAFDITVGASVFIFVGVVTVILDTFVHWMAARGLPPFALFAVVGVKWALFGSDLILYAIYFIRSFIHHVKLFLTAEVR